MANYLYRCGQRHETTESAPIGTAPAHIECVCGRQAARVPTAPMLSSASTVHSQAVDTAAASAENPEVVSHPPPRRDAQPYSADPRHARLPRP